jgi:hypothetical protein
MSRKNYLTSVREHLYSEAVMTLSEAEQKSNPDTKALLIDAAKTYLDMSNSVRKAQIALNTRLTPGPVYVIIDMKIEKRWRQWVNGQFIEPAI